MKLNGSLHIVRYDPPGDLYGVTYAPYQGGGGRSAEARVQGEAGLREFLARIGINENTINETAEELRRDGRSSIGNVLLSREEIRAFGLGAD